MDVQLEKAAIIERFQKVKDESLIKTFKNLLDFALAKEEQNELLESSISKGLKQSKEGKTRPHKEVMQDIRKKYNV